MTTQVSNASKETRSKEKEEAHASQEEGSYPQDARKGTDQGHEEGSRSEPEARLGPPHLEDFFVPKWAQDPERLEAIARLQAPGIPVEFINIPWVRWTLLVGQSPGATVARVSFRQEEWPSKSDVLVSSPAGQERFADYAARSMKRTAEPSVFTTSGLAAVSREHARAFDIRACRFQFGIARPGRAAVLAVGSGGFAAHPRGLPGVYADLREGLFARTTKTIPPDPHRALEFMKQVIGSAHHLTPEQAAVHLAQGGALGVRDRMFAPNDEFFVSPRNGKVEFYRSGPLELPADPSPRFPDGGALGRRKVTIVGLGAVGFDTTLVLARAGVRTFQIIDQDFVELCNLGRLGTDIREVLTNKVDALSRQIAAIAPSARVLTVPHRLGRDIGAAEIYDYEPDLIIDCTADDLAPQFVNAAAVARKVPAIFAWVSDEVTTARLFRVIPGVTPCYRCLQEQEIPELVGEDGRRLNERPVWVGRYQDILSVTAAVARMAVRTLLGEARSRRNPDHVILKFGGVVPNSRTMSFRRDPECAVCGDAAHARSNAPVHRPSQSLRPRLPSASGDEA